MSKQKEALRLALGALETGHSAVYGTSQTARAITAIREALADSALERTAENERELGLDYMEPAQQQIDLDALGIPHGTPFQPAQQEWPKPKFVRNVDGVPCITLVEHEYLMRSRTSPPASKPWVGLTEEDIGRCFDAADGTMGSLIAAIEAKLKEKNT